MKSDEEIQFSPILDINELAKRHDLRLVIEPRIDESDRLAKQKLTESDAEHARRRDWRLFNVTLGAVIALAMICLLAIFINAPGSDNTWAKVILTAMVTGIVGYLFGKSSPRSHQT